MSMPLLSVRGLSVAYGRTTVLQDISFDLGKGETLALVGLSGCGKTTILRALLGLLPPSATVEGSITTPKGHTSLSDTFRLRSRLGQEIGFVAQNPFDACAPLRKVRAHLEEAWRAQGGAPDPQRIADLCTRLGLPLAMLELYPHEWSGGMLQRANIAAAVALDPAILIADEPTSAVDADRAQGVMTCLRAGAPGVLVVSHDLPLVAGSADRVILVEDGRIAGTAAGADLAQGRAAEPLRHFARITPRLRPRAPIGVPVLDVEDLALDRGGKRLASGLTFALRAGEILGVAGPSGAGKSTLLAILAGSIPPAKGRILRHGVARQPDRGEVLPLFQDALTSMNPRWPLTRIVAEPLTTGLKWVRPSQRRQAALQALAAFGLGHLDETARPGMLSMGQSQRVALARASLGSPSLVLADEPTSALDPRQKAAALDGLSRLAQQGAAIVLVSHDSALLTDFCHRVLNLGPEPRQEVQVSMAS